MRTLAAMALALLLVGCGDSGGDETLPAESDGPPLCADVWIAGQTLADDYDGCENPDGSVEAAVTQECTDGSLFTGYQDRYWATLGGEIKDSGSDGGTSGSADYAADYDACFAD